MTENDKKTFGIILFAMVLGMVMGVMCAPWFEGGKKGSFGQGRQEGSLTESMQALEEIVRDHYVDSIDIDTLSDVVINAILSQLDPHSYYLSPEVLSKQTEEMEGVFEGVGMRLYYYGDTVYVSGLFPDSPAEKAGLLPGDKILKVDTVDVLGTEAAKSGKVVDLIRGPRGTYVDLTVERGGQPRPLTLKARRNYIFQPTVMAALMIDKTTGFINIERFGRTTGKEFRLALEELKGKGMKSLVLDLRGNGGGSLDAAIDVCNELLPAGDMILYIEGAHSPRREYRSRGRGLFPEGKLTVMIDEKSASASEIVAGAIQDNDRGRVAGRRSFGKGLVQGSFEMPGGAMVMLTTAHYYTPSGRCVQRPYDMGSDSYYSDYFLRLMAENSDVDSMLNTADTTEPYLTKNGRKVYGGGGIMPDQVLPYMRDSKLVYYNQMANKQVFSECAMDYVHNHYPELMRRYPDAATFVKNFTVTDALWDAILAKASAKGIARDDESIRKYGIEMRNRFKGHVAQMLYGGDAFYRTIHPYDVDLQRINTLSH